MNDKELIEEIKKIVKSVTPKKGRYRLRRWATVWPEGKEESQKFSNDYEYLVYQMFEDVKYMDTVCEVDFFEIYDTETHVTIFSFHNLASKFNEEWEESETNDE